MTEGGGDPGRLAEELAAARAALARQAGELEAQRAAAASGFPELLRATLLMTAVTERALRPTSHDELLELIVRTAMRVISAEAAALLLTDPATNTLVFEVVLGGGGQAVARERIPIGQGIAGWVALTGEPLAVADAA